MLNLPAANPDSMPGTALLAVTQTPPHEKWGRKEREKIEKREKRRKGRDKVREKREERGGREWERGSEIGWERESERKRGENKRGR